MVPSEACLTNLELVEIAGRRSSTWWLLSRLVMEQPQDPWLSELETVLAAVDLGAPAPLGSESRSLLVALREARNQPDGLTALAIDRARLLAGIMQDVGLLAPFESASLGVPMNSDWVDAVAECYREAGVDDFASALGPPDFLGTELRFMALLAYSEMQAYEAGDAGLASVCVSRQCSFMDAHLLNWVPRHCQQISAVADTAFYAALGALLERACELDRSDLEQLSDWRERGQSGGAEAMAWAP